MRRRSDRWRANLVRGGRPCAFINRCGMRVDGVCETQPPPVQRLSKGSAIRYHRTAQDLLAGQSGVVATPISPSCASVD